MRVFKYEHYNSGWYDNYAGFYFMVAWPTSDGKTLANHNSPQTCREYFSLYYQDLIRQKKDYATEKAYAFITSAYQADQASKGAVWLEKVKVAMTILNAFEKHYGIPLTKVYPVANKNWAGRAFVIGSKRWTNSRYSFGLWTLFFQLGHSGFASTKNFRKLLPSMKWPELYDRIMSASGNNTLTQARTVLPHVDAFFAFEKKHLRDRYENWDPGIINGGMQRPEGIVKLVTGCSYSPIMKAKWRDFYDVYKKKSAAKAV